MATSAQVEGALGAQMDAAEVDEEMDEGAAEAQEIPP
jgi:hypothetical protein